MANARLPIQMLQWGKTDVTVTTNMSTSRCSRKWQKIMVRWPLFQLAIPSLTDEKINRIIALLHSDQWLTVREVAKEEGVNTSFCFTILYENLAMQHHPCWLCKNAYSVYSQLLSMPGICLFHPQLRTRHAVITRNPINTETFTKWTKYYTEKI